MEEKQKIEEIENLDPTKTRFSGATWFQAGPQNIIIGGAGGIGSWVALSLGRIGHSIALFDADIIEDVNLAGQFYSSSQIGLSKAAAVANNIKSFSGNTIAVFNELYTDKSFICPIMFSCFDNMKARREMFENWKKDENRELFVDGRLLMEIGEVYTVTKGREEEYEKYLFDDSEVEELVCNLKATTHAGMFIGALMTSMLNNYLYNKVTGMEINVLPLKTEFNLPLNYVKDEL